MYTLDHSAVPDSPLAHAASTMSSLTRNASEADYQLICVSSLEAIAVASAVQADIARMEVVADVEELFVELSLALTCFPG